MIQKVSFLRILIVLHFILLRYGYVNGQCGYYDFEIHSGLLDVSIDASTLSNVPILDSITSLSVNYDNYPSIDDKLLSRIKNLKCLAVIVNLYYLKDTERFNKTLKKLLINNKGLKVFQFGVYAGYELADSNAVFQKMFDEIVKPFKQTSLPPIEYFLLKSNNYESEHGKKFELNNLDFLNSFSKIKHFECGGIEFKQIKSINRLKSLSSVRLTTSDVLSYLEFSQNHVNSNECLYINLHNPKNFSSNPKMYTFLTRVSIEEDSLEEIPKEVFWVKNLKKLELYSESGINISKNITKLENLAELTIIAERGIKSFEYIKGVNFKHIKKVKLKGLDIKGDYRFMQYFQDMEDFELVNIVGQFDCEVFRGVKSLKYLQLSNNNSLTMDSTNPVSLLNCGYLNELSSLEMLDINAIKTSCLDDFITSFKLSLTNINLLVVANGENEIDTTLKILEKLCKNSSINFNKFSIDVQPEKKSYSSIQQRNLFRSKLKMHTCLSEIKFYH